MELLRAFSWGAGWTIGKFVGEVAVIFIIGLVIYGVIRWLTRR